MQGSICASLALGLGIAVITGCADGSTVLRTSPGTQTQSFDWAARFTPQKSLAVPFVGLGPVSAGGPLTRGAAPNDGTIYVMVCEDHGSECVVLKGGKIFATLGTANGLSNPEGTRVDSEDAYWFIANTGASNVPYYSINGKGQPSLVKTIQDSGQYPGDVAIFDKGEKQTIAISNIFTTGGQAGSVTVVQGTKSYQLTYKDAYQGIGIGFDSRGNCYWSFNQASGGGGIVEFERCKGKGTQIVSGLGFAGAVATDKQDNLWYADQTSGIYKCYRTKYCSLAFGNQYSGLIFNFSHDFATLYIVGREEIIACSVQQYTCSVYTAFNGQAFSIAPWPGQI